MICEGECSGRKPWDEPLTLMRSHIWGSLQLYENLLGLRFVCGCFFFFVALVSLFLPFFHSIMLSDLAVVGFGDVVGACGDIGECTR